MAGNGFVACVAQTKNPALICKGGVAKRMMRLFALTAEEEQRQSRPIPSMPSQAWFRNQGSKYKRRVQRKIGSPFAVAGAVKQT